jgi:hypothetical protein
LPPDIAENTTDGRSECGHSRDDHDGQQGDDQRILHQALALLKSIHGTSARIRQIGSTLYGGIVHQYSRPSNRHCGSAVRLFAHGRRGAGNSTPSRCWEIGVCADPAGAWPGVIGPREKVEAEARRSGRTTPREAQRLILRVFALSCQVGRVTGAFRRDGASADRVRPCPLIVWADSLPTEERHHLSA